MRIKINYLGLVRNEIRKKGEEIRLKEGSTLSSLLSKIITIYGEQLKRLFDITGESKIDPTFIVTINGKAVDPNNGKNVFLKDGDVVNLMTLISGG